MATRQKLLQFSKSDEEAGTSVPDTQDVSQFIRLEVSYSTAPAFTVVGYLNTLNWDSALNLAMGVLARGCYIRLSRGAIVRELSYQEVLLHGLYPGDSVTYQLRETQMQGIQRIERVLRTIGGFQLADGLVITQDDLVNGVAELTNYQRTVRNWY